MHVAQLMLVEAETAEEAIDAVRSKIIDAEYPSPNWSDWKEIGGRWSGLLGGANAAPYTDAVCVQQVEEFLKSRQQEMENYLKESEGIDVADRVKNYDPFAELSFGDDGMKMWRMQKVLQMLNDDWTPDTGVYDLEAWSASLRYFRQRCALAPEMQFAVVVDFHF